MGMRAGVEGDLVDVAAAADLFLGGAGLEAVDVTPCGAAKPTVGDALELLDESFGPGSGGRPSELACLRSDFAMLLR